MMARAGMSEVKFKVRLNALLLCEFTTEQMVRITGLKPESVRTELQRMKQEGLLEVAHDSMPADQRRKRGGQYALYRLVSDPEKRLALSHSVESFYPEKPRPAYPTSRHYQLALRLLDKAAIVTDGHERESLLREAEEELDFALSEEGAGRALESVQACINLQRGRLFYLRGDDGLAEPILLQVHATLKATGQAAEVRQAEELLSCMQIRRCWNASGDYRPETRARRLLEVLRSLELRVVGPLAQMMSGLLRELSYTPQERIIADVVAAASRQTTLLGEPLVIVVRGLTDVHEILDPEGSRQVFGLLQTPNDPTRTPVHSDDVLTELFQPRSLTSRLP